MATPRIAPSAHVESTSFAHRLRRGAARFHVLWTLAAVFLAVSFLTRVALAFKAGFAAEPTFIHLAQEFLVGFGFDVIAAAYFFIPLALFLALLPDPVFRHRWFRPALLAGCGVWIFLMLFNAVAEWTFWDEFGSRYNFVAVDYLLYTHEVIGNIEESYPVRQLLSGMALLALAITYGLRRHLLHVPATPSSYADRLPWLALMLALPTLAFATVDTRLKEVSDNRYVNELAGNGVYEFFAAAYNNELEYARYYRSIPVDDAFTRVRKMLATPHATLASNDPHDLTRTVSYPGAEQHWNVVLISVESLSAEFFSRFGNTQGITPRLDQLARDGLLFTNLYANGTRTVRGLEALSLAIPPTPGQSIVKRPNNADLFSLGAVLKAKGYATRYIYGGYGYFDNMNAFFSANDYDVVDRVDIPPEKIHFENIWGVADEDLFTKTLEELDASHAALRPMFAHVMTTSNHRPYTYPEGRIDIPSHTGRDGGVKYTDWAIGDFIDRAKQKPWFKDTLFVIVADHCASSAGKTDLPADRYHIPAIFYAPAHIQPQEFNRLASQIDIPPTVLGQLNMSYRSKFFGYDLFDLPPGRERGFVSTYELLGYMHDGQLVQLGPHGDASVAPVADGARGQPATIARDELTADAIAWYEVAAYAYSHGLLRKEAEKVAARL